MSAQPVLLSIPQAIQLERILYATDFSRASERALPIVSALARHYGSQCFSRTFGRVVPIQFRTWKQFHALKKKRLEA